MRFFSIALVAVTLYGTTIGFPQNDDFTFDGPADRPQIVNPVTTTVQPSTSSTDSSSTTPASTTMSSTDQARYDQCINRCPVTMEYNPVCGTDNVDYSNPGGLGCAQTCGRNIELQYYGRCQTTRVRGR